MNARLNSSGIPVPDARAETAARARQQQLTKPPGSLGRLEELACWFAARLRSPTPQISRSEIFVFAADHGVAVRGVSAFPQSVTAQMLGHFANSGAAINVLASLEGCRIEVVDVGVAGDSELPRGVRNERVRPGTRDLFSEAAMTDDELTAALSVGERCAREAVQRGAQLLIAGDMGIANTTAAACLICAFTDALPQDVVGRGTGGGGGGVGAEARVRCGAAGRGSSRDRDRGVRRCPRRDRYRGVRSGPRRDGQGCDRTPTVRPSGWARDCGDGGAVHGGRPKRGSGVAGWLYFGRGSACGREARAGCSALDVGLAPLG